VIIESDILCARVLIVDDLPDNVRLLQRVLGAAGYTRVESTMDPTAVCAMHREHRYDLILLDLMMPGMDGFAVLEGLKAIEPDNYAPVLVVTAQPGHKLRALHAGAKDFISKPFDLVELKARVHNLLEVRLLYRVIEQHNRMLERTVLERTVELRASEERFRRLTELSSDWYWEQDVNGNITRMSGPALEMLRLDADGTHLEDSAGAHWNEAEHAELEANIAARRPFLNYRYSRTGSDGVLQNFEVSGEPIFGESGRYIGYRGIGMEVTQRRAS
jgi:PAS domain S-box-containing protein